MDRDEARRYLLIKAKGGLGNRILSAIGGLIYADLTGRQPIIDWRDGVYAPPGVNAYPLLFETNLETDPEILLGIEDVSPKIWAGHLNAHPTDLISKFHPRHHSNPFIYRLYCVNLRNTQNSARIAVYWSYLPKFARMRKIIYDNTRFSKKSIQDICFFYIDKYFTPKSQVLHTVNEIIKNEIRPVLGVHIRYTDLKVPLNKIEREIDLILEKDARYSIFLATDNLMVQERIAERYGNVFSIPKWFPQEGEFIHHNPTNPDRLREAENALIDMWALAMCDKIIFSSSSTFSYTSRILGQFTNEDAIDVERHNFRHILKSWLRDRA